MDSRPTRDIDRAVSAWLSDSAAAAAAEHGYASVHLDDLVSLDDEPDVLDIALMGFRALVRQGEGLARDYRLLLSFPLTETEQAVPFDPKRQHTIWTSVDLDEPPSLSIVDVRRDSKLYDEEKYIYPLDHDVLTAQPDNGRFVCHYIATRSRLYRDNGWNYASAIVFEYYPNTRLPSDANRRTA
jgi:hypothetical protein